MTNLERSRLNAIELINKHIKTLDGLHHLPNKDIFLLARYVARSAKMEQIISGMYKNLTTQRAPETPWVENGSDNSWDGPQDVGHDDWGK